MSPAPSPAEWISPGTCYLGPCMGSVDACFRYRSFSPVRYVENIPFIFVYCVFSLETFKRNAVHQLLFDFPCLGGILIFNLI